VHRDQRFSWQPTINSAPRSTVYMATNNKQCTAINGLHGNRQASRTNEQVHLTQSSVAATPHRTTSVSSFVGNEPQNFVPRIFHIKRYNRNKNNAPLKILKPGYGPGCARPPPWQPSSSARIKTFPRNWTGAFKTPTGLREDLNSPNRIRETSTHADNYTDCACFSGKARHCTERWRWGGAVEINDTRAANAGSSSHLLPPQASTPAKRVAFFEGLQNMEAAN